MPWRRVSLTHLLLGVDGWDDAEYMRGGGVDRGVCDPAQLLGTMIMRSLFFVLSRGRPHPPRIDPGLFARARVDLGVVFVVGCNLTT